MCSTRWDTAIRPCTRGFARCCPTSKNCGFVGRARTLRWMETDYVVEDDPYGLEIEAVDSLRPGDVVVHSTDRSGRSPRGAN